MTMNNLIRELLLRLWPVLAAIAWFAFEVSLPDIVPQFVRSNPILIMLLALALSGLSHCAVVAKDLRDEIERLRKPVPDIDMLDAVRYVHQQKQYGKGKTEEEVQVHIFGLAAWGHLTVWGEDKGTFHSVSSVIPPEVFNTAIGIPDFALDENLDPTDYLGYQLENNPVPPGEKRVFRNVKLNKAQLDLNIP